MFRNIIIACVLLIISVEVYSQRFDYYGDINTSSVVNPGGQTPFWLWANTMGQISQASTFMQTGELSLGANYSINKKTSLTTGARFFGSLGENNHHQFTEYYLNIKIGKVLARFGAKADSLINAGILSSNGSLLNSRNARPYPSIRIAPDGYIKIGKKNFYMSGMWEETILLDNRVVDKARLHHKNIFLRFGNIKKLQFEFGLDHYAYWGGTSPSSGKQPVGFTDYLRAILARPGGSNHSLSDQKNVAGNSLGQYFFIFRKNKPGFNAEFRLVHPFEDASGMGFFNIFDNLYSFYLKRNNAKVLKNIAVEVLHTKHQSGDDYKNGEFRHRSGRDNYLKHSVYSSGHTYYGRIMGSPFFFPVIVDDEGKTVNIENTRIIALYLAGSGNISEALEWKFSGSYSWNYGTYITTSNPTPYDPVRKQLSVMASLSYSSSKMPFYISGALGYDNGKLINLGELSSQAGFQLKVGRRF